MSLTDSEEDIDIEPGSSAALLLQRLAPRERPVSTASTNLRSKVPPPDNSLEAQILGTGIASPFNTWQFEDALRQQAFSAVDRRQHEIEAHEAALSDALSELSRVRAAEEARLAARVADASDRFHAALAALQQSYLAEVEKLKRRALEELQQQRARSEAAIAARARALQGQLRHERPAGLNQCPTGPLGIASPGAGLGLSPRAEAIAAAAAALVAGARPVSPGPGSLPLEGSPARPYSGVRMRSSPTARAATGSPAPAASPPGYHHGRPAVATPAAGNRW